MKVRSDSRYLASPFVTQWGSVPSTAGPAAARESEATTTAAPNMVGGLWDGELVLGTSSNFALNLQQRTNRPQPHSSALLPSPPKLELEFRHTHPPPLLLLPLILFLFTHL
jgi:hypothetical protein